MHNDIDKNYSLGSLYLGIGFSLISISMLISHNTKEILYSNFGLSGIVLFAILTFLGLIFSIIGILKKHPKSKHLFDANTFKDYFDEQDIVLLYKSQSFGFIVLILVLLIGYAISMSGETIRLYWVQYGILSGFAAINLYYYWLTKDAYDDE